MTVLCCTVTNATALVEALGLDATHSLMQTIYTMALDEMQRYDGTIQHVTSNGFLALFGAPVAQEDHARRAVLAALRLQQRLRHSQPVPRLPSGADLEVSMALHTGLVALGQIGTDAHRMATVVGDTPMLAATFVTQIALQPLGPDESRQVVRAILRRTPLATTFEQELLAKAEGNPFFLEELARTVIAQGGRPATLQVPDTIQAFIAARIDRLRGVLLQLGEFERVRTYMHEAEALAQTLDDPHRLGRGPESPGPCRMLYSRHAVPIFAYDALALTGRKRSRAGLVDGQ